MKGLNRCAAVILVYFWSPYKNPVRYLREQAKRTLQHDRATAVRRLIQCWKAVSSGRLAGFVLPLLWNTRANQALTKRLLKRSFLFRSFFVFFLGSCLHCAHHIRCGVVPYEDDELWENLDHRSYMKISIFEWTSDPYCLSLHKYSYSWVPSVTRDWR